MIARWQLKAAVQGGLSLLPQPWRWNRLLQGLNGSLDPASRLDRVVPRVAGQVARYRAYGNGALAEATVVELGTGAFPLFATLFALAGAREIHTFDVVPLATDRDIARTLEAVRGRAGGLGRWLPVRRTDRLRRLGELHEMLRGRDISGREALAELGVHYDVRDASCSGLAAASVDLIASHDVLEHVPAPELAALMGEFRRIAKADAIMSHFINMGDHYAEAEPQIGAYNFYRYSERRWRWFNNALQYQNRLRLSDYEAELEQSGWQAVVSEVTNGDMEALARAGTLAPEFAGRSRDDLLALQVWLVCRPAAREKHMREVA